MSEPRTDSAPRAPAVELGQVFAAERGTLFALCYRMTGSAADADDLVQETFARALATPPARQDIPWRPWLVRVALNLARDELRRRKRRAYDGPWLPEPLDDAELGQASPLRVGGSAAGDDTHVRYELRESASFAFLLALEALGPAQRAALLLRDVFEYTSLETAQALGVSEANARVLLHRARRALAPYHATRFVPDADLRERCTAVAARFMALVARHDVAGLEALLAEDVVALNDANGRFAAARVPVVGRSKVARFHVGLARLREGGPVRRAQCSLNGSPAIRLEFTPVDRFAPRAILLLEHDANAHIRRIYTVIAPEKLERAFR